MISIEVQEQPFVPGQLLESTHADNPSIGALVCFTGYMRDFNQQQTVTGMFLEHIPDLTEKSLQNIAEEACQRWPLLSVRIVHRTGLIKPAEPIVLVAAASAHRGDAFAACEFIMDYLKTRAPFWKKEYTPSGSHWVEGRFSDQQAASRWHTPPKEKP